MTRRRRPAAWAAHAVPCPACGATPGERCEEPPSHADGRQTWFRGAGVRRAAPHAERIVAWTSRPSGGRRE